MNPCLLASPMVDVLPYPSRLMTMSDYPQSGQWLTPDSVRQVCGVFLYLAMLALYPTRTGTTGVSFLGSLKAVPTCNCLEEFDILHLSHVFSLT